MSEGVVQFEPLVEEMVEQTERLARVESPSEDLAAIATCADAVADVARGIVGAAPERIVVDDHPHLLWSWGAAPSVLLVGHYDTVWPIGTLERVPIERREGRLHGPGTFDMKAGIVIALHSLAALGELDGVALLLTCDEESGSRTSRRLIEECATGTSAVLVLEPGAAGGALKVGRKGVASYRVRLHGRAAHAGLEPERGINAVVEAAHEVLDAAALAAPGDGTTVTPTVVHGGTAVNVVAEAATVEIDVRAMSVSELERVSTSLQDRTPMTEASRTVDTISWRPPLERHMADGLFARAQEVASDLGLPAPAGVVVGGGSDGNYTAALGVPTLDGLGAVGDGAHAPHEHVEVDALAPRAALLAALVDSLRAKPVTGAV
jgi:glutamate carboxypeptidase